MREFSGLRLTSGLDSSATFFCLFIQKLFFRSLLGLEASLFPSDPLGVELTVRAFTSPATSLRFALYFARSNCQHCFVSPFTLAENLFALHFFSRF